MNDKEFERKAKEVMINPKDYLCWYNKEYTDFISCEYENNPIDDRPRGVTECPCDNCFYGRDKLANEIIKLNQALKDARNQALEEAKDLITKYMLDRAHEYDADSETEKRDLHGFYSMDIAKAIESLKTKGE